MGKACLYFKRLADLDAAILETLTRSRLRRCDTDTRWWAAPDMASCLSRPGNPVRVIPRHMSLSRRARQHPDSAVTATARLLVGTA